MKEMVVDIYDTTSASEGVNEGVSGGVLYFDCDLGFTLGECIMRIREFSIVNKSVTVYFIKGLPNYMPFGWEYLWNYMKDYTDVKFNIVFRGNFPERAEGVFKMSNVNIYLSDDMDDFTLKSFKSKNYNFELI